MQARMELGAGRSLWQKIVDLALTDVGALFEGVDDETVARLERALLEADFGVDVALGLVGEVERASRRGEIRTPEGLRRRLETRIREMLEEASPPARELRWAAEGPTVVLLLGVNGAGKTTTAARLAHRYADRPGGVVLAAADTFRAGAAEQLEHWARRTGARFVGGRQGGDPAAVAYDAVEAARNAGAGLVLVDTAGRLHTRSDLLEELEKVDRVVSRRLEGAPHERLLVVDATSGQNVVRQAAQFGEALDLTGTVLAKFDSTGRAGTVVSLTSELGLPVRFLGTGEGLEDLEPFDTERFLAKALAEA